MNWSIFEEVRGVRILQESRPGALPLIENADKCLEKIVEKLNSVFYA